MLRQRLSELARDHGCVGFGVTTADPFPEVADDMQRRLDDGSNAGMAFTYTDVDRATAPHETNDWVRSLVSVAFAYVPGTAEVADTLQDGLRIARFAETDHYRPLRDALDALAAHLEEAGYRAEVFADDSRLVDRAVAVRAGVGWWGKSTMVLVPGSGPWVLLGSVMTDAVLAPDEPMRRTCGTCIACIPACPTGAITEAGALDARRCLAHWLQAPGAIPVELRPAIGSRLYGCDDCLTACPPGHRALARSVALPVRPTIKHILGADDQTLLREYDHFYLPGRRPRILRRNALVAAGNDGSPDLCNVVIGYLGHPDWLLRGHAGWAVGHFDAPIAEVALEVALDDEDDPRVKAELEGALGLR